MGSNYFSTSNSIHLSDLSHKTKQQFFIQKSFYHLKLNFLLREDLNFLIFTERIIRLLAIKDTRFLNYFHIKEPMKMLELKLDMIIDKNPYLTNALHRSVIHPFSGRYSYIPYFQTNSYPGKI